MSFTAALQLTGGSWLIPGPTNIGIVDRDGGVYLVDSGNDKDAGRNILKGLKERDWTLKAIVNTHSNADHIGGNRYLQEMTKCEIWATVGEAAFINTPVLEGSFLWGGFPYKELRTKFFEAKPSEVTTIIHGGEARDGMSFIALPGHFFDMIGVLTDDKVFYLGDSLFGERTLEKYKIPYIYDVKAYRSSIERLKGIEAEYYVPSHGEVQTDIGPLADLNLGKVDEIEGRLTSILRKRMPFEDILGAMCDAYGISLDYGQYVLVGNTMRSFLAYLYNEGRASYEIEGNVMYWSASVSRP